MPMNRRILLAAASAWAADAALGTQRPTGPLGAGLSKERCAV